VSYQIWGLVQNPNTAPAKLTAMLLEVSFNSNLQGCGSKYLAETDMMYPSLSHQHTQKQSHLSVAQHVPVMLLNNVHQPLQQGQLCGGGCKLEHQLKLGGKVTHQDVWASTLDEGLWRAG